MPNPPTFKDLKRFKQLSNRKSFKLTFNGIKKLPQPLNIPSLPPFDVNPIILGIQPPSPNLVGTESLLGLSGLTFKTNFRLSPFNKYRYLGRQFNENANFITPSLFFVNNDFITLSKTLSFDPILGENFIRQETYNKKGEVENIFYSLSTFDFEKQRINAITSKNSITGVIFTTFSEPIIETIDVTPFLSGGDIFLNGKIDGEFYDDIYYDIKFENDFIDNNIFTYYRNQITFEKRTINFTFNVQTTDSFTINFSAFRNDGIPGLNITTIEIPVNILYVDRLPITGKYESITNTWNSIKNVPNPGGAEDKFRFLNSPGPVSGEWNTEWWGYNSRDLYNFSGVTYRSIGWSAENNVVLITPKHGVCNEHWGSDPNPGDIGFFYDHTNGNAVSAEVVSVLNTGEQDIRMVKFDRDLTAYGDIKVYKLPLFLTPIDNDYYCVIYQGGNGPFGTGASDRHAGLGTNYSVTENDITNPDPGFNHWGTNIRETSLWSVSSIFSNSYFSLSSLAVGDSSSPSFIVTDDILFVSGFWFAGGGGPNYGLSSVQTVLSAGLETLGNSEGYTLSTVEFKYLSGNNEQVNHGLIEYLNVTVQEYSGQNYFYIDGNRAPSINLLNGYTYRFLQNDSSNNTHPLRFSTTNDGIHNDGLRYDDLITSVGLPGTPGAYIEIEVREDTPNLFYYCQNHPNMGGNITV